MSRVTEIGKGEFCILARYEYDERNLLWKLTAADGNVTEYNYTPNGKLSTIKDANGNETQFGYDPYDRLKTITYPDNSF